MLVLSRREGDTIQIGTDVVLTVVEIRGNSVRLGIEAPAAIAITRPELSPLPPLDMDLPDCRVTEGGILNPKVADDGRS